MFHIVTAVVARYDNEPVFRIIGRAGLDRFNDVGARFFRGAEALGVVTVADAEAVAVTEVVAVFKDGEDAYIAEYSETIASLIKDYLEGKIQPTVEKAHLEIAKYSLEAYGDRLI